jgi:hypothetical protein
VMGLELAPLTNLLFVLVLAVYLFQKKQTNLPQWQTIFNLSMFLLQIALLFI